MKPRVKIGYLLTVLMMIPVWNYAQSKDEIIKYLENSMQHECNRLANGALNQICNVELIESKLQYNYDEYGGQFITNYVVKAGNDFKEVGDPMSLLELPEFYQNLKTDFKLKTEEDGLVLQTALSIFTQDLSNEGFFWKENKWYFIRSKFFNRYFIVETDKNGKIQSIKYTGELGVEIPDEVHFNGEVKSYPDFSIPEISEQDNKNIFKYVKQKIEYRYELEEGVSEFFSKISGAKFYKVKFILIQNHDTDRYSESVSESDLITYEGEIASASKITDTELFIKSTSKVFKLKTDADAQLFQNLLNEIEANDVGVRFYKKDDLWIFVRSESFGEENGYIVKTNNNGTLQQMSHSGFTEADILRFRMQDPEFKVNYGFKIVNPTKTDFNYNSDELINAAAESGNFEYINVEIEFNEQAVNAIGAWILTRQNGENVGMRVSTEMTSPFTDNIPVNELSKGKHKVEYLLLPPGQETDNPLGIIILNINID